VTDNNEFQAWWWGFWALLYNYTQLLQLTINIDHWGVSSFCFSFHDSCKQSHSQSHIATDGQSVSKSWCRAPSGSHDQIFITVWQLGLVSVRRPLWREDWFVLYICSWPLPAQSFSDPSPLGLATIFYCFRFETFYFVVSLDSQGHGGGIRPRLHTGRPPLLQTIFVVPHKPTARTTHRKHIENTVF
jgi:hypothetical protein